MMQTTVVGQDVFIKGYNGEPVLGVVEQSNEVVGGVVMSFVCFPSAPIPPSWWRNQDLTEVEW